MTGQTTPIWTPDPTAAEQPRVLTLPDGWESRGQSASPWGAHHGVICDALEFLWTKTTTRRAEIEEALRSAGEWHNHDQEEAHCDPGCPAWQFYGGGYCAACGEQHTTVQPHPDLTLTDDIQATEVAR